MQNKLLSISETIAQAKKSGAYLGHGDPKVHLAYLTKIRLLPQAIRRKAGDKIIGFYPDYVVLLVSKIEGMRASGLTYSQIRYQLQNETQDSSSGIQVRKQESGSKVFPVSSFQYPVSFPGSSILNPASVSNGLAFLLIGLILGFLLANNNNLTTKSAQAAIPVQTDDSIVKKVYASDNPGSDPIYLIAIPDQNLYKLGKANINLK